MLKLINTLFSLAPVRTGLAVAALCAPIVLVVIFRSVALRAPERSRRIWFSYRQNSRLVFLGTVACWWAIWDWSQPFLLSGRIRSLSSVFSDPAIREMVFCLLPLTTFATAQTIAYFTDKSVGDLRWSRVAIFRQAFWSLLRNVAPLLLISAAFEEIFDGELLGTVWFVCAFIVFIIGRISHDRAMGINPRLLKSGEIRNRAMAMAEKMNVDLRRVYVVPQGKGHLLNAFAGFGSISLTDTLSQRLNRAEVDSAIAHEFGHLKLGHGPKALLILFLVFAFTSLLFFGWPARVPAVRPALDFFVILVPFLVFYFFSRRFEYQADRESASRNPEVEISSLVKLHRAAEAPIEFNVVTEMFLTHPSLIHRVEAIARRNGVPETRVEEILGKASPKTKEHATTLNSTSS
jgi:Zn-dependent protease with chaperone function